MLLYSYYLWIQAANFNKERWLIEDNLWLHKKNFKQLKIDFKIDGIEKVDWQAKNLDFYLIEYIY